MREVRERKLGHLTGSELITDEIRLIIYKPEMELGAYRKIRGRWYDDQIKRLAAWKIKRIIFDWEEKECKVILYPKRGVIE